MKKLLPTLLLIMSFHAGASATITTEIKTLWVNDASNDIVYLEPTTPYPSTCNPSGSRYFIIYLDRTNMKEAYSMALAAFMSGTKVNVGGKNECRGNNEVLRYIYLQK